MSSTDPSWYVHLAWLSCRSSEPRKSSVLQCVPKTGGRLLLKRRSTEKQTEHKDFVVRNGGSAGFFVIVSGKVSAHFCVPLESHFYAHYNAARKKLLKEKFVIEEAESPPTVILVDHESGSEWCRDHCIPCSKYSIPENHDLPDAIPCAYGDSAALGL